MRTAESPSNGLERYVPRLASDWSVDSPDRAWQQIESTLCFVDLSGFTQLSERLAKRGRIGAEELTEVLNRVFREMLDVAYERGGALVKFGGDALLLHFSGPDHALHAACSAVEMRAALRQAAQVETSVGRVPLRMSVGIHTGTVTVFRVGSSHHELVVSGAAATHVALMESVADAGEILVSADTARCLPASAVGAAKGDGFLLRWRQAPVAGSGSQPRRIDTGDVIAGCLPTALRWYLAQDVVEPEHRVATVAFVKFEGVDQMMTETGPDGVAAALDDLVCAVQGAVDRAGVTFLATDVDKNGGKVILVTGVPTTQGDDEGRMLRAVGEIVGSEHALHVRAGIHRGHVFAGEVGSTRRATFTIIGDTVNLAARLMSAAPPGGIYATPEVLDRSRTEYASTALEPFRVKGKSQPVRAFSVGRAIGPRVERSSHVLPFRGRDDELDAVLATIDGARGGRGSVLTVVGATGVGKSRLIDEALASAADVRILRFHAEQSGSSSPYRCFRDPLRTLLEIERDDQSAMAARLHDAVSEAAPGVLPMLPLLADLVHVDVPSNALVDSIDLRFRPDRTADALIELLEAVCDGPVLLVFEDAQWMDSASSALIERACSLADGRARSCIVVRRPDGAGPVGSVVGRLELAPLEPAATKAIVIAATAATPLRPHEVDLVVERSAGSPLFLGEVLGTPLVRRLDELPASLEAVVNAEIDALDPAARRLLRYTSVLGRSARVEVLGELLAEQQLELDDTSWSRLDRFLEHDGSERVRFRQEMHREVAYAGLTYRRRRQLHLTAGRVTERMAGDAPETVADLLAMHYAVAQDHVLAWKWATVAGDRARRRYANLEAATHYLTAIDAARKLEAPARADLCEVWRTLGDVYEQLGMFEDAIEAYRRAAGLAGSDLVVGADLLWRRARARMHLGTYRPALAEATRGIGLVRDRTDTDAGSVRARLIALQALLRQAQQRAAPAAMLAEQAIEEARSAGDDTALARAYLVSEWANRMLGNGSSAHGELALALYERVGDLDGAGKASNNLGAIAYFDGRWDDAVKWYRKALDCYRRCGNDATAGVAGSNLGELLVSRGEFEEAETMLREAIRVMRASRALDDVLFAEVQLGRLLVERGDAADGVAHLATVRAEAARLGQIGYAFEAAMQLAAGLSSLGSFDEALEILDDAVRKVGAVDALYESTLARVRAMATAGSGRPEEARRLVDDGLASARRQGLAYEEALLLRLAVDLDRAAGRDARPDDLGQMAAIFTRINLDPAGLH